MSPASTQPVRSPAPPAPGAGDDADDLSRVEFEVAQLLRRADRTVSRGIRSPGSPSTGTMDRAAYLLLRHLADRGAENVNILAEQLGLDPSTVTRQVSALEKVGQVRRTRDPHDGRAVLVAATDAGLSALDTNRAERRALYGELLAAWSPDDRALLAELLGRLNGDLDAFRRGHA